MNQKNSNDDNDKTLPLDDETRIMEESYIDTSLLEYALRKEDSYNDFEKKYSDELGVGSFVAELRLLLFKKDFDIAQMPIKSGISKSYFYQLANGTRAASRDKIILVGFTVKATLDEVNILLKSAKKQTLYAKSKRDSVIMYALLHKYDVNELNKLLLEQGHQILA